MINKIIMRQTTRTIIILGELIILQETKTEID